jgi:hypothetical protein
VAHDIGRAWLASRGRYKSIEPDNPGAVDAAPPNGLRGEAPVTLRLSRRWRTRAEAIIAGMTQTYLKRGRYPVYVESGSGATVRDVDGRTYVDYVCSLGAATLGHSHPAVTTTVRDRVGRGVLYSLPSPVEAKAAEQLAATVPGMDMVRFLKTSADACSAAVRLARHVTGRDAVRLAGYHGWHDQLMCTGPGIPEVIGELCTRVALTSPADDEDLVDAVRAAAPPLAAVLLSAPVPSPSGDAPRAGPGGGTQSDDGRGTERRRRAGRPRPAAQPAAGPEPSDGGNHAVSPSSRWCPVTLQIATPCVTTRTVPSPTWRSSTARTRAARSADRSKGGPG